MFKLTKAFTHNDRRPLRRGMKSHKCPGRLAVLAWAFILSVTLTLQPGATHAQVLYGSLTGNVTDSAGAAGPAATVPALKRGTHGLYGERNHQRGIFPFTDPLSAVHQATIPGPG